MKITSPIVSVGLPVNGIYEKLEKASAAVIDATIIQTAGSKQRQA